MIIILTLFLSALFYCGCKTSAITCDDLQKRYFLIFSKVRTSRDSDVVIRKIENILVEEPRCEKALQLLGITSLSRLNIENGKNYLLRAQNINSASPVTNYHLATIYDLEGKKDSALHHVQRAIESKFNGGIVQNTNDLFSEQLDIDINELFYLRALLLFDLGYLELSKKEFLKSFNNNYELKTSAAYLACLYNHFGAVDSSCYYYSIGSKEYDKLFIDSLKCTAILKL